MEAILDSWMFSTEFLFGFCIVYIGIFIWMGKNFKIPKPKKGDEWVVITHIKKMWRKLYDRKN